jgi:hypothetical protein
MPGFPLADGGPSKKIKLGLSFLLNDLEKISFFDQKSCISDEIEVSEKFLDSLNPICIN